MHICIGKQTIIGSDNGLSPGRRQAIIWTNAGILLIRTLGTNFSEILTEICASSFKKMHLKMLSVKWRPFCLGLNVLIIHAPGLNKWQWTPPNSLTIPVSILTWTILCNTCPGSQWVMVNTASQHGSTLTCYLLLISWVGSEYQELDFDETHSSSDY